MKQTHRQFEAGECTILLCDRNGVHSHTVCPSCGSPDYGNILCSTCRAELKTTLNEIGMNGEFTAMLDRLDQIAVWGSVISE